MNRLKKWVAIRAEAIQWMFKKTVGDEVTYRGQKYNLRVTIAPKAMKIDSLWVPYEAFNKVWSLKNMIHSYRRCISLHNPTAGNGAREKCKEEIEKHKRYRSL